MVSDYVTHNLRFGGAYRYAPFDYCAYEVFSACIVVPILSR